jgi:hypothetical protein
MTSNSARARSSGDDSSSRSALGRRTITSRLATPSLIVTSATYVSVRSCTRRTPTAVAFSRDQFSAEIQSGPAASSVCSWPSSRLMSVVTLRRTS